MFIAFIPFFFILYLDLIFQFFFNISKEIQILDTLHASLQFSPTVSQGAQEIFKLLPHTFIDPSRLPELFAQVS